MTDSTEADIVERLSRSLKPFWSYTQKDVISDAMAEITKLRAERDALQHDIERHIEIATSLVAERDAAARDNSMLRDALRPFVTISTLGTHEGVKLINKKYGGLNPINVVVTKFQYQAAYRMVSETPTVMATEGKTNV